MIGRAQAPAFTIGLAAWAQTLPQQISPTAAKIYLGCSLRFYFERVACIKKKTSVTNHLGKSIHAALMEFHLARWRGLDDSPETIAAAFEKAFANLERDVSPATFGHSGEREKTRLYGLRAVAAFLDSPEAMKEKPRAVEVLLKEKIRDLSVPLTGALDLVEGDFTPVVFKSSDSKSEALYSVCDHGIQLVCYQLLLEASTGVTPPSLDLVFLVKAKKPKIIRVSSPPANAQRKRRVIALLETAVEGIASNRFYPQPGMQCSSCQYRNECQAWLPESYQARRAA